MKPIEELLQSSDLVLKELIVDTPASDELQAEIDERSALSSASLSSEEWVELSEEEYLKRKQYEDEICLLQNEMIRQSMLEPYAEQSKKADATVKRLKGTRTGKANKKRRYDIYEKLAARVWKTESDWSKEEVAKKVREALAKDNCYKKYGFNKLPSVSSIRHNITKPT